MQRRAKAVARPQEECTEIPVPAITGPGRLGPVQQRLADNKKFATRSSKVPSMLQGLAACAACGYGYCRTSAPPPAARSTSTSAWARTTTATKAAGSAATSRSAPTTWTR